MHTQPHLHERTKTTARYDVETLVGSLLLGGVLLSVTLLLIGLAWHWLNTGRLELEYTITGMNLFQFIGADVRGVAKQALRPRLFVNLGLTVLLLTPYLRVLVSLLYFALVERNWKYTVFTGFVLSVLTYSLFMQ